jgi:hypothetical protein
MYASIIKVTPSPDYSLMIVFEDGQSRILDMTPFLDFGVFRQIRKPENSNRVHVAFDTVEWECGIDLDPEFVMKKSVPAPG